MNRISLKDSCVSWFVLLASVLLFTDVTSSAAPPAAQASSPPRARVLIVTGMDYPGHLWRQTTPVLREGIAKDPRLEVFVVEDPHFLDSSALNRYDTVVLHFQTWEQAGPGEAARENLRKFVDGGKGVVLLHFACGAWHNEWPEFANIAGRIWAGPGPGVRQHDPYGTFKVEVVKADHPILRGVTDFEVPDELYTCLTGDHPIEVLLQAKSKVDQKYYPIAFTSQYGKGRTFHCVLGHDTKALSTPAVQELFKSACAWTAGLEK